MTIRLLYYNFFTEVIPYKKKCVITLELIAPQNALSLDVMILNNFYSTETVVPLTSCNNDNSKRL